MEYTVNALASLAGITARTLRWYDRLGLLKPGRTTEAGYRIYGPAEIERLQQILLYRELELPLEEIRAILDDPTFDRQAALQSHLAALEKRRERMDRLIETVKRTLLDEKGEIEMTDKERFEGLKKEIIEENEKQYGKEVREKYGPQALEESGKKLIGLSEEAYRKWKELEEAILSALAAAVRAGEDPAGEEGRRIAELHRQWLEVTLPQYAPQIHRGIAAMYVEDERFTAYYDREVSGCARFLRDAVMAMTEDW
ncbi:MAG: MerR family transcriptional regulator [Oscillospiraceae bacterium]|nr:MerR family transcriptional regulator [Oscillospiraceae bacterium]